MSDIHAVPAAAFATGEYKGSDGIKAVPSRRFSQESQQPNAVRSVDWRGLDVSAPKVKEPTVKRKPGRPKKVVKSDG